MEEIYEGILKSLTLYDKEIIKEDYFGKAFLSKNELFLKLSSFSKLEIKKALKHLIETKQVKVKKTNKATLYYKASLKNLIITTMSQTDIMWKEIEKNSPLLDTFNEKEPNLWSEDEKVCAVWFLRKFRTITLSRILQKYFNQFPS